MTVKIDRVGQLLGATGRNSRVLLSPEGVPLVVSIAGRGERVTALALDLFFMTMAIVLLYVLAVFLFFAKTNISVGMTLILFLAFLVRNLYFIHFELAWQGRTPGKKICGLRVINRQGGELSPSAIVARNLTREVEMFLPVSLFFSLGAGQNFWQGLALLGWSLAISTIPLFNRERLRAGDIIAGTQVISIPKRLLLPDLTEEPSKTPSAAQFNFTQAQLSIYGTFELQVLEEFLRRPPTPENDTLLASVCEKIRQKINWPQQIPIEKVRAFLTEFYTAERADLERNQLMGRAKADKHDTPSKSHNPTNTNKHTPNPTPKNG